MPYVVKRPGSSSWYYREAVPADVKAILAARHGRVPPDAMLSLRTTDRREAERLVIKVRARQHEVWDELRSTSATVPNIPSQSEMVEAVTSHVHQGFLRVQRAKLHQEVAAAGGDMVRVASQRRAKRAQAELLPSADDVAAMERLAAAVSREQGWGLSPGDGMQGERWQSLILLVTRAVQVARSDLADLIEGKDAPVEHAAVVERLGGRRVRDAAPPGESIAELLKIYERERLREGIRPDTVATERKILGHFSKFVGEDVAVTSIERAQIREFKRALADVPHRWTTRDELAGMRLADAARAWTQLGGPTRSARTVNREVSAVSAFFMWLEDNAYVEESVAKGFRSRIDKLKHSYPPFTDDQLRVLFNSPLFTSAHETKEHLAGLDEIRDWRYWLPLCALYTGARAGEIAQLETADVCRVEDIWVFDFNDRGDGTKKLKTASSRRIVPVHPALVSLGFLNLVRGARPEGHRLFGDLEPGPRGDWSYHPSKFWARYLRRIGMKQRGLNLHSFRHTFADECRRAGVDEGVLKALLGHSDHSQTGRYGKLALGNLRQRKEAIDLISFGGLHSSL